MKIPGFGSLYEVFPNGIVYSTVTTQSRRCGVIKPYVNKAGYYRVNLYDAHGNVQKRYVHRLVAQAFVPGYKPNLVVNHIDGNKANNTAKNLEWCTQKQNIEHSFEHHLEHRSVPVLIGSTIFPSMKRASIEMGWRFYEIGTARRQYGNVFRLHERIIKCGDAIARN